MGGASLATLRKRFAVPAGGEALNSGRLKAKLGEVQLRACLTGLASCALFVRKEASDVD